MPAELLDGACLHGRYSFLTLRGEVLVPSPGLPDLVFAPFTGSAAGTAAVGFRFGHRGTHTSRTLMLAELTGTLAAVPMSATRRDYADAIITGNCLGKSTVSTRRLTNQRLGELYALDPLCPLFRVLRRLWEPSPEARPLLALLAALARDPLFRATAASITSLAPGEELSRAHLKTALQSEAAGRLSEAVLDKVARNAASSWRQAGHLVGRTFKVRRRVEPTGATVAFALYLGHAIGFRGEELLRSGWVRVLDCDASTGRALAVEAKRMGFIDVRGSGAILELGLERLDPGLRSA